MVAFQGFVGMDGDGRWKVGSCKYIALIAESVDPSHLCRIPSGEAVGLEMLVLTARYSKRPAEEAFWLTCWP